MSLTFWRLTRVTLVVLGPVLTIYLLIQWTVLPELRGRGERLLQNSAATIREGVDRFLGHWIAQAESNAADPAFLALLDPSSPLRAFDDATKEASALRDSLLGLRRVGIWNAAKVLILEAGDATAIDAEALLAAVAESIATGESRVFAGSQAPSLGEPRFFFSVPMKRLGRVAGAFGVEVSGEEVRDLLRGRLDEAAPGSFGALYDEKSRLLASSFPVDPDWLERLAADPAIAGRLGSMPAFDSKMRERLPEKAGDSGQAIRPSQSPTIFSTRVPIEGEKHRVALERISRAPWSVTYEAPESSLTGLFDQAGTLILVIGLIASAVAFFSFQPDRRTLDSMRSLRPELSAGLIAILLIGATLYLRSQILALAAEEAQANCKTLAMACARQIEEHFRLHSGLLRDFSSRLVEADALEPAFRERAAALRRDFGGTLFVRWDAPPKDGPRGVWLEGEKGLESAKPRSASHENESRSATKPHVGLFEYPGGGEGVLVAARVEGEDRRGWIYWAESLSDVLRQTLSLMPADGYQVTIAAEGKKFPLLTEFRSSPEIAPQRSRAALSGEDWEVEVGAGESMIDSRYRVLELAILVLGFVLAVGGAAAAYISGTSNASLREVSSKDELTGIRNRRSFNEMMEREIGIASRYRRPLSLMLLDLDHFKKINDTMGHAIGDEVLRVAAEVLSKAVRETDVPFRFGGEEFAVLMAETDLVSASGIAERIRGAVETTPVSTEKGVVRLTVSIGVTGFQSGESVDQFLTRADMALYRAKSEGRNRVVVDRPVGWEA